MAARGNEVALSIEEQIRESIVKMVGDIRSSVEDVRKAVDQQLDAAMQSVQADANSISFRTMLQRTLSDFEESLTAAAPAAPAPVADASRIKNAIQQVERGKSQVDVLNALLDRALTFGSRAALLILKGDAFAGWKGVGFSQSGGNDDAVKRFTSAPGTVAELDQVLKQEQVVAWDGASLASRFGASAPARALLVPMVIKDKIAAAVYVDQLSDDEQKFDQASIELLVFTTGLLIDTLAIRKKIPSPSLSAPAGEEQPQAPRPAAPTAPPPAPAAAAPPQTAPPPPPKPTFSGTIAVPSFDSSGTGRTRQATIPGTSVPPPPPKAAEGGAGFGEPTVERASTQYIPPPGLARGGALHTPQSDDTKKHDEARRFARLLVSEIKLYNEAKVEQGRRNRDLYERLKEDIDRSRQMYDERISDDVRKASNYFYDELVRILADGDADTLGL